ncbi:MAG: TrkH family potassium uptake protein, partial [Planctomycetes bacterium]|nr:TrkH family potassium uptake protein [Planctomycetota bacterium]
GVRPRIAETARALWLIYLGLSAAAVLALRVAGMDWFDSLCHTMSMVSTGGLSTRDASIAHYDSAWIDGICMVFMLLAGVNFSLFFAATRGRWKVLWKDEELRVYLALKIVVIVIVTGNILGLQIMTTTGQVLDATIGQALRYAGFQTIALHTGTGFATSDYDQWPFLSRTLLIGLMFVGGCAGSTAGGIKVIRFWIVIKVIAGSLEKSFRPQVVRPLRIGRTSVDEEQKLGAMIYVVLFFVIGAIGAALIGLLEGQAGRNDFLTAMSASLSTIGNIGPGLHAVGPTKTYAWFTDTSLGVMSMLMMLGRLEVYAVAVLILPRFWKGE